MNAFSLQTNKGPVLGLMGLLVLWVLMLMPSSAFAGSGGTNYTDMFLKADRVVQFIMVLLILFSVWSWVIIFDKALKLGQLSKKADQFQAKLSQGRPLEEVAAKMSDHGFDSFPRMTLSITSAWNEARSKPINAGQSELLMAQADRELSATIASEADSIEDGLSMLAVIATASPFIGLFGTVWGIMNAFSAIATVGDTNLTTVAPAISEALFATALGLGAAIPAYIAFNLFNAKVARYLSRLEGFADELMVLLTRKLAEKLS
jgi:biopolymer transport protein TolQ